MLNLHWTAACGRPAPAASFDSCKRLLDGAAYRHYLR